MEREIKKSKNRVYTINNLETLKNLIFLIDCYRVHHYEEIDWVDKAVKAGELGWGFRRDWKNIKRILMKMAALPKPLFHLSRWARIQEYVRFIGMIVSTFTMIVMGVTFFFFWGRKPGSVSLITTMLGYIAAPLIIAFVVSFLAPPLIARKIQGELSRYRQEHPKKFQIFDFHLKETVQILIDSFVHQAKTTRMRGEKQSESYFDILSRVDDFYRSIFGRIFKSHKKGTDEYSFELFNVDYSGIKVVKKPSRFRKFYIVTPNLKHE